QFFQRNRRLNQQPSNTTFDSNSSRPASKQVTAPTRQSAAGGHQQTGVLDRRWRRTDEAVLVERRIKPGKIPKWKPGEDRHLAGIPFRAD
ncbi:MAG: hypothetical protein O2820_20690, partial [Planctomycetota bacterium]|nr:hypothetical protein [Planctomycetota bacterium]